MNKLHLYTGEGKGKTTAAMGLALRSLGHGNTVLIAQFMKNGKSGELTALKQFSRAIVMTAPPIRGFTFRMTAEEKEQTAREQTDFARETEAEIRKARPAMIILDELGMALDAGMIGENDARMLLSAAMSAGETAVTGRRAPSWLAEQADYLTRMIPEKHPFMAERLPARKGVEW